MLVVPFGTGIGDMVEMRPLLIAIREARPGADIAVLCPPALAWLLPSGCRAAGRVHGVSAWGRARRTGLGARLGARLAVGAAGRLLAPLTLPPVARALSWYLVRQEFHEVINLLEDLGAAGFPERASSVAAGRDHDHLLDVAAGWLARRGIAFPVDRRRPRLRVPEAPPRSGQVLLVPGSGSTLKEASPPLWVEVARGLLDRGLPVGVVDAPDSGLGAAVLRAVPRAVGVAGALREVVGHVAAAPLVVAPDTGLLHVAAALGTPWVGLFGSTDARLIGPYGLEGGVALQAQMERPPGCRRCPTAQLLPVVRCPVVAGRSCLDALPPRAVVAVALQLLGRA
ncbi:MAG: hypothetical protein NVSMB29_15180 [Candidatus Dormibacteria bacterium]